MELIREGERFVCRSTYEERALPKGAGFRWDPAGRRWWTDDVKRAAKLAPYAVGEAAEILGALARELDAAVEASRATDATIEIPAPAGLDYLPFQRAGIAYALARPSTLIGDEMGLGKTIQAIGLINADPTVARVVIVCPASLKRNWARELERWLTRPLSVAILQAGEPVPSAGILIVNYDILTREGIAEALGIHEVRRTPKGKRKSVLVIEAAPDATPCDLLIADEVHYAKNRDARRTQATHAIPARRRLYLTGTPIVNRPIELYPIVAALDPETWGHFWSYARRYCDAYRGRWGWDLTGASHLDELQERLRSTILVRRLKKDVLTDLPPKVRQVVEIANGEFASVAREREAEARLQGEVDRAKAEVEIARHGDDEDAYAAAVARLQAASGVLFSEISRLRHETAVEKIPYVVEHLREAIASSGKVVCFAHHHDVVDGIRAAFPDSVEITGRTAIEARQEAVDRFQTDPRCPLFVGSITAAGVGLTLTASSTVIFAELDWVPGNVTQAEDRCHRIGQQDSVLVQHLVLDGSIDARMAHTLVKKQAVIDSALDRDHATRASREAIPIGSLASDSVEAKAETETAPAEPDSRKAAIAAKAERVTPEISEAILGGLRTIAGVCDSARSLDGAGFAKVDVIIGHSLAERDRLTPKQAVLGARLCVKYHRQIPDEVVRVAREVWL